MLSVAKQRNIIVRYIDKPIFHASCTCSSYERL